MIRTDDDDEILAIAVPVLCELAAVVLFLGMMLVYAALKAGA
jgi:hypothetical protein